jgi:CheY-specific phosphatase CheX
LLTKEQIIEVLDSESGDEVSPGIVAIHKGFMTANEVEKVQLKQVSSDKLFSEVAEEFGFITKEQAEEIKKERHEVTLSFMQAIVDKGFMSLRELQRALEEYRLANEHAAEHSDLEADGLKINPDNAKMYGQYINAFTHALRKFASLKSKARAAAKKLDYTDKWLVAQTIKGEETLGTGILASRDVLFALAKAYSKEEIEDDEEELALDSVAEFLNVLNGLFVVSLSNQHIDVDLEAQRISKEVNPEGSQQMNVEIETPIGSFYLIIASDSLL